MASGLKILNKGGPACLIRNLLTYYKRIHKKSILLVSWAMITETFCMGMYILSRAESFLDSSL